MSASGKLDRVPAANAGAARGRLSRAVGRAAAVWRRHGVLQATPMLLAHGLSRACGVTVHVCLQKAVTAGPSRARPLRLDEVERSGAMPAGEALPGGTLGGSRCYGVVEDGRVRAFAWGAETDRPIPTVRGAAVLVPGDAVYVYRAFTDPSCRGRGYLGDCLRAIEDDALHRGRRTACALVELHNVSSRRAFRRAGYVETGVIVTAPRLRVATCFGRRTVLRVRATS